MNDLKKQLMTRESAMVKKPVTDKEKKIIKESTTDPNSGYMHKNGKPNGFHYLAHRTVDPKYNIIS
jgi:hypothetical protein